MDGDLVLTEEEVGPVFGKLRKEGIEVSALHNHLIGETPRVMFLYIEGQGDAREVAMHIKQFSFIRYTYLNSTRSSLK